MRVRTQTQSLPCSTAPMRCARGPTKALRVVVVLVRLGCKKKHRLTGPEDGAATERFLVPRHERGRRAVLGPSAIDAESGPRVSAMGRFADRRCHPFKRQTVSGLTTATLALTVAFQEGGKRQGLTP